MKGMFISAEANNNRVSIGTINNFRYAMPLWDVNRSNSQTDGWIALGNIYRDADIDSIDVWDCPSGKSYNYWQKTNKDNWPPGESPGKFSQSAYAVRSGTEWIWTNY